MEIQLLDPVSRVPLPAVGVNGKLITSLPANAAVIIPSDNAQFYNPPVQVWVGDTGPVTVTVVPYGLEGDKTVQYTATLGMILPVLVKRVNAAGTSALNLRAQW